MSKLPSPCINLEHSYSAHSLDENEVVHSQQLVDFKNIVASIVKRAKVSKKQSCNELDFDRSHDVITVHGQRGVGKSTFMFSAIRAVTRQKYFDENELSICPLGVIDPTMMGGRENILLIILQKIKERVESAQLKKTCNPDSSSECLYAGWRKKFKLLGEGLQTIGEFIDGKINSNKSHEVDSQLWLSDSLSKAKHGAELERDFHEVLRGALELIGNDAFIIGVDDVDTRFEAGWPVLETIRKYLTSPKLVVVLSGDMELYTELVRHAQLKMFGFELRNPPKDGSRESRLIETLIEQYVMKILPPQNHIRLKLMNEYSNVYLGCEECEGDCEDRLVRNVVLSMVEQRFLALNIYSKERFVETILTQPIRTLLRFLSINNSVQKDSAIVLSLNAKKELLTGCCELYRTQLQQLGLTFDESMKIASLVGIPNLIKCLNEVGLAQTKGLTLQPRFSKRWVNEAILPLNLAFLAVRSNEHLGVAYFLRGCMFSEAMFEWTEKQSEVEKVLHMGVKEHLGITGRRLSAILSQYNFLYGQGKGKLEEISKFDGTIAMLPAFLISEPKTSVRVSVLPLFGIVGDMLFKANALKESGANIEKIDATKVFEDILEPMKQLRDYSIHAMFVEQAKVDEKSSVEQTLTDIEDEKFELQTLLKNWAFSDDNIFISPAVVAQAHTRFKYAMSRKKDNLNASDFLQQSIIILLYSFLLEEYLYENDGVSVSRSNPYSTARVLSELYSQVSSKNSLSCKFSRKLLRCPLWWPFLDISSDNYLESLVKSSGAYKQEFSFLEKITTQFKVKDITLSEKDKISNAYGRCKNIVAKFVDAWSCKGNKAYDLSVLTNIVRVLDRELGERIVKQRNSDKFIKTVLPILVEDFPELTVLLQVFFEKTKSSAHQAYLKDSFPDAINEDREKRILVLNGLNAKEMKAFQEQIKNDVDGNE